MTLSELETLIPSIQWFSQLGENYDAKTAIALRSIPDTSPQYWDWLPTSRDEPDPIHGITLLRRATEMGREAERRTAELAASRAVLVGLRRVQQPHPKLISESNDFTQAAFAAATYAVRMAIRELVTESNNFWCSTMPIYADGHWPCGITKDNNIVVL